MCAASQNDECVNESENLKKAAEPSSFFWIGNYCIAPCVMVLNCLSPLETYHIGYLKL